MSLVLANCASAQLATVTLQVCKRSCRSRCTRYSSVVTARRRLVSLWTFADGPLPAADLLKQTFPQLRCQFVFSTHFGHLNFSKCIWQMIGAAYVPRPRVRCVDDSFVASSGDSLRQPVRGLCSLTSHERLTAGEPLLV